VTETSESLCPLCERENNCSIALRKQGKEATEPCWCVSEQFPPELLGQVKEGATRCICLKCLRKYKSNAVG
jgi:hypothetical protein